MLQLLCLLIVGVGELCVCFISWWWCDGLRVRIRGRTLLELVIELGVRPDLLVHEEQLLAQRAVDGDGARELGHVFCAWAGTAVLAHYVLQIRESATMILISCLLVEARVLIISCAPQAYMGLSMSALLWRPACPLVCASALHHVMLRQAPLCRASRSRL